MLNQIYNFAEADTNRVLGSVLTLVATLQSSNKADTSTIGVSAFFIAQNAIGVDRTPFLRRDRSHGYIVLICHKCLNLLMVARCLLIELMFSMVKNSSDIYDMGNHVVLGFGYAFYSDRGIGISLI